MCAQPRICPENETNKLLWDFEIQTDYQIPASRPVLEIVDKKKRTCCIVDFAIPADLSMKLKESEKKDKYLDIAKEIKKTMEHESNCDTSCDWHARYSNQRIDKGIGGLRNEKTGRDHPNDSIKIGPNI